MAIPDTVTVLPVPTLLSAKVADVLVKVTVSPLRFPEIVPETVAAFDAS